MERAAAWAFPRASHPADQEPDNARRGGDRPASTDLELHAQHHIRLILQSAVHSLRATSRRSAHCTTVGAGPKCPCGHGFGAGRPACRLVRCCCSCSTLRRSVGAGCRGATFRQPVLSLACGRLWPRRQLPLRRGDELESVARKVRRARKLSGSAPDGRPSARRRNPRSAARCRPDADLESVLR